MLKINYQNMNTVLMAVNGLFILLINNSLLRYFFLI